MHVALAFPMDAQDHLRNVKHEDGFVARYGRLLALLGALTAASGQFDWGVAPALRVVLGVAIFLFLAGFLFTALRRSWSNTLMRTLLLLAPASLAASAVAFARGAPGAVWLLIMFGGIAVSTVGYTIAEILSEDDPSRPRGRAAG
jgi:hypothetical protein